MSESTATGKKARPSLFGAVGKGEQQTALPRAVEPTSSTGRASARTAPRGRQDRADKRQIAGFFSPECAKQLRMLAAERDTTVQDLLREGLNLMFGAHGKPPIA